MKDLPDIIRATIAAHHMIEEGDHVILGLSGGPDSLSLFHVLNLMQKEEGHFTLSVVHVDHMFRGEDSREDRRFVENLCRHYRVHCDSSAVDCPAMVREEGLTPEEAGRRARYDAFARAAKGREGVVKVAVAQNRNDQAETILFHLARGTGLDGLCGMDYVRRDTRGYQVIRPLLDAERADIEAYCRQQQLAPRFDSTNQEMEYTRNRIRLGLIPYMEREFNGRIVESIARMGALLRIDRAYLEQEAEAAAQRLQITRNGRPALDREGLAQCPEAIRARALRAMFRRAGLLQDVRERHIRAAEHLLTGGQASGSVDLPRGYRFEVSYDAAMMAAPAAETASAAPDSKQIDLVVMRCDEGDVKAPVPGKLRSYTEIPDEAFASGVLGEGVGITPEEEEIYAPFDGTVTTLAESKHAIGLTGPGGMELLIHVGVDTVMMNGDGFEPRVKEGDKVTCGQPLMHFDRKKIKAAGHPDVVVVLMTNSDDLTNFRIML